MPHKGFAKDLAIQKLVAIPNEKPRIRSLSLPHRAMRASAVRGFHSAVGFMLFVVIVFLSLSFHNQIWDWQIFTWSALLKYFGLTAVVSGYSFGWEQRFLVYTAWQMGALTIVLLAAIWLTWHLDMGPTFKGFFMMISTPIYLYALVVFIYGFIPVGVLDHVGPEWLYGEIILWCLLPLLYAVFIFPIPMFLPAKILSLILILFMSVTWRSSAPLAYVMIAYCSKGVLAIPGWMALGPWADYFYIIPVFSATLYLHRGKSQDDYRT